MRKARIIYVHGINTSSKRFFDGWDAEIRSTIDQFMTSKGAEKDSYVIESIPVKWESRSWHADCFNIWSYRTFRDRQISRVMEAIRKCSMDYPETPVIVLGHSWGAVWCYKALHRLQRSPEYVGQGAVRADGTTVVSPLPRTIYHVMIGGALGGTNMPFVSEFIRALRERDFSSGKYKIPKEIVKWYNFYNKDDHVSSKFFYTGVDNREVVVGQFRPGLQEHDAMLYISSEPFKRMLAEFCEKYLLPTAGAEVPRA